MAQHLVSGSYERFVFAHRIPEIASIARQVRCSSEYLESI